MEAYNKSRYKHRIFFFGYTPDEIVADLYNVAEVFVYPSFYEGFGLSILEAQACGCPVIASNNSALKEVLGESGLKINPRKTREIADSIKRIILDNKLKQKLIKKGFKNIKRFSWRKTAKEIEKIHSDLLKQQKRAGQRLK
jgi:glycosyltransferase involved in cell wall biosynthesis